MTQAIDLTDSDYYGRKQLLTNLLKLTSYNFHNELDVINSSYLTLLPAPNNTYAWYGSLGKPTNCIIEPASKYLQPEPLFTL